jgi:hypothetical protein
MAIILWESMKKHSSRDILLAQRDQLAVYLGGFIYAVKQDMKDDWNCYSKAWHRSYGPKTFISNRRVEMFAQNLLNPEIGVLIAVSPVKSFRGNYLIKAVNELEVAYATGILRASSKQLMAETAHIKV